MAFKVFVSHSTEDLDIVKAIHASLTWRGVDCYVSSYSPAYGQDLPTAIMENLKNSDCIIALLTKGGTRSPWVNQEIGAARVLGKIIIPLVERGVKVRGVLQQVWQARFERKNPNPTIGNVAEKIAQLKVEKEFGEAIVAIAGVILFLLLLYRLTREPSS